MRQLITLLQDFQYELHSSKNATEVKVSMLSNDNRKLEENGLFCAIKGVQFDGHSVIETLQQKSLCILCETLPLNRNPNHTYILVENSRKAWGLISAAWFEYPSLEMKVIGITGTNGKTSCCTLLYHLYESLGKSVGLLSTVEIKIKGEVIPATHTTPDAYELQKMLRRMADSACTHVFMEVSSHALDQHRVAGIDYTLAAFTNITHDHLDYHLDFKAYIYAKKLLFDHLSKEAIAIVNIDDKRGNVMLQNCKAKTRTLSAEGIGDYNVRVLDNSLEGLQLTLNGIEFFSPLVGKFNAYNIGLVYAIAVELGIESMQALQVLSAVPTARGRFERVVSKPNSVIGIVDYAHTPDALQNVLSTIQGCLQHSKGRIVTVVGCGGNRDMTKRPKMAAIAAEYSNKVFMTSDNPRNEDPQDILDQMAAGVKGQIHVERIVERDRAILAAVGYAEAGDCVLVAGKGHETYQEIKGVKHPFDDNAILLSTLKMLNK